MSENLPQFFRNSQDQFNQKIGKGTLIPGALYFVGKVIHRGVTGNTFETYGAEGSSLAISDDSPLPADQMLVADSNGIVKRAGAAILQLKNVPLPAETFAQALTRHNAEITVLVEEVLGSRAALDALVAIT